MACCRKRSKTNYSIKEQVNIYDTPPAVLHASSIKPPKNIDGKATKEILSKSQSSPLRGGIKVGVRLKSVLVRPPEHT